MILYTLIVPNYYIYIYFVNMQYFNNIYSYLTNNGKDANNGKDGDNLEDLTFIKPKKRVKTAARKLKDRINRKIKNKRIARNKKKEERLQYMRENNIQFGYEDPVHIVNGRTNEDDYYVTKQQGAIHYTNKTTGNDVPFIQNPETPDILPINRKNRKLILKQDRELNTNFNTNNLIGTDIPILE
jgi:hypothetical protein